MIKSLASILVSVMAAGVLAFLQTNSVDNISVMHWSDLGIANQIQIISGIVIMIITIGAAVTIFRSVWIRKGYEGLDEKLEAKEVATMLSHVIAFFLLLVFEYMITFNPYLHSKFPDYAFWICAAGFVGPEIYLLINFLNGLRPGKKKEGD